MSNNLREWLSKPIPDDKDEALDLLKELAEISQKYPESEDQITLRPSQAYEILKLLRLLHGGCITETQVANQAFKIAEVFYGDFKHLLDEKKAQDV